MAATLNMAMIVPISPVRAPSVWRYSGRRLYALTCVKKQKNARVVSTNGLV